VRFKLSFCVLSVDEVGISRVMIALWDVVGFSASWLIFVW
jgi:hypothetical protein